MGTDSGDGRSGQAVGTGGAKEGTFGPGVTLGTSLPIRAVLVLSVPTPDLVPHSSTPLEDRVFPSISLAQEIGIAVLLVAAAVWLIGLGHMLWDNRFHHPEPGTFEGLSVIPAQRGVSVHPMESV